MDGTALIDEFVSECWERVFGEVRDAVVYIDHETAECLHWYTSGKGYLALKNAGAIAVQELAMYNFRYAEVKATKKMIIISSSNDIAFYRRTVKMILAKNAFEICKIFCAAASRQPSDSPSINKQESWRVTESLDYTELRKSVKEWMSTRISGKEPLVSISFVPLFIAAISDDVFVTPPFFDIMPPIGSDLTNSLALKSNGLAIALHTLFERINVREDVYFLGKFSKLIAEKLVALASDSERKKGSASSSPARVSLILIDRTLDLCTPSSNDTECILSKVLSTLPRLPSHSNDVMIRMSQLFCQPEDLGKFPEIPGCLAAINRDMMGHLISKEPKKVLLEANLTLNDALCTIESPQAKSMSRVSVHSLQKRINKLRELDVFESTTDLRQKVQMILAIVEASTAQNKAQLELLTSLEKLILQNLSVSGESTSILAQLGNIIRTRTSRGLNTETLLALLIHVYDLAGVQIRFAPEQEKNLEESIADAIHEDIVLLRESQRYSSMGMTPISSYQQTLLLLGVNDQSLQDDSIKQLSREMSSRIMQTLRKISSQRSSVQNYRSLIVRTNTSEPARRVAFVEQVAKSILEGDTAELYDLQQSTSHLVPMGLKSLFGRTFAKSHPQDNPWILIYIVGGIAPEEVKVVREVALKHSGAPRITVAGSRLLKPADIVDKVLLSSILDE